MSRYISIILSFTILFSQGSERRDQRSAEQIDVELSQLKVKDIKICKKIYKRTPVGADVVFTNSVDSLYCYTRIQNTGEKKEVKHIWYYEDQIMTQVRYNVKKSNNYHSWTKKTILPHQIGQWKVHITDEDGHVLGGQNFLIVNDSLVSGEFIADMEKIIHRVRFSESLYTISEKYNVSIHDIATWNKIRNRNKVRVGQKLIIWKKIIEQEKDYPKPKLPADLALEIQFKEPSGNNYLDAEETGELQIKIINKGMGEAYGMETTISIKKTVSGLLLENLSEKIKTDQIDPEEFVIIYKKVSATESITSGEIAFEINVTEFNGFDLYPPGKLLFETKALIPPDLHLVDIGINDLTNYNGRIDPNEVVEAKAIIQNKGQGTAKGVTVLVVYGDNVYNAGEAKSSFSLGDMEANEIKEIDFSFFANRNASNDLPIKLSINEQRGKYDKTFPADLVLNKVIKKATEIIVAGKDEELISIADVSLLSIDIEKNIPNTKMKNKNGFAVVIGNREYSGDVPDVEFALRDAEYIKEYLIRTLGYREGNIFYYTNATLSNMKVAFNELKNAVKKGKSDVFVYYSGHGAPDPDSKQGFFVPVDANPNHIAISGYPIDDLYAILNQTGARSTTVVIDACFSGSSDQGMILKDISPVFIEIDDSFLTIDNSAVFTSATGEQVSSWYRDKKHSLFTYYFLKALQGDADSNKDNKLTMSEIKVYVDEKVPYMARLINNRVQTPQLITNDQTKIIVTY
tara:strand:- start:4 stop:2232 length:2229 start_codon:yes stop_codon:yes gene_type:complete